MWDSFIEFVSAIGTPLLALIALQVWKIKTNDLPHIHEELQRLNGIMIGKGCQSCTKED